MVKKKVKGQNENRVKTYKQKRVFHLKKIHRKMRAKDRGTQLLCEIVFCPVLS